MHSRCGLAFSKKLLAARTPTQKPARPNFSAGRPAGIASASTLQGLAMFARCYGFVVKLKLLARLASDFLLCDDATVVLSWQTSEKGHI